MRAGGWTRQELGRIVSQHRHQDGVGEYVDLWDASKTPAWIADSAPAKRAPISLYISSTTITLYNSPPEPYRGRSNQTEDLITYSVQERRTVIPHTLAPKSSYPLSLWQTPKKTSLHIGQGWSSQNEYLITYSVQVRRTVVPQALSSKSCYPLWQLLQKT